jgi:hypothetical protein
MAKLPWTVRVILRTPLFVFVLIRWALWPLRVLLRVLRAADLI